MTDTAACLTVKEKRAHRVGHDFYRHPACGCLLSLPTWRQRLGEWVGHRFARWMERGFGYGRFRNGLATGIDLNRGTPYSSCGVDHG